MKILNSSERVYSLELFNILQSLTGSLFVSIPMVVFLFFTNHANKNILYKDSDFTLTVYRKGCLES